MSSTLYRLGRWAFRARRLVLVLWIGVLALAGGAAALLYGGTDDAFRLPGTESGAALDTLSRTFPQVSGTSAQLVVVAPDGAKVTDADVKGPLEAAVKDAGAVPGVAAVTDPFGGVVQGAVSDDGTAALVTIQLASQATNTPDSTKQALVDVESTLQGALPAGATAALGGDLYNIQVPGMGATEGIGLVIAVVVLVVTFGSFVAAGLPLLTALLGVGISTALIYAATGIVSVNSTTPLLAIMLGLAVGLDYTLFVVNRHRTQLATGMDTEESAARALATAGSAVVFAGLTVMIALAGLFVANMPFLTTMGIAAAFAVGVAVLIALTLPPALLGFAGERLRPPARTGCTSTSWTGTSCPTSPSGRVW